MAYFLVVPICLYIVLATIVLQRFPRGLSNVMLAIYLASAAVNTGAYLVLNTTGSQSAAQIAAVVMVLLSSWCYLVFLPLTLISLYFEAWFRLQWRRLLAASLMSGLLTNAAIAGSMIAHDGPLVYSLDTGFLLQWGYGRMAANWLLSAAAILSSQIPLALVVGAVLLRGRLTLWRGAVPFVLASLLSLLIQPLALMLGPGVGGMVAGLGQGLPVLLLARFVFGASSRVSLAALVEAALDSEHSGVIVIDAARRVLWKNAYLSRWVNVREFGAVASPHLFELLRGSPLTRTVRRMVANNVPTGECEFMHEGEQYVVQIDLRPFESVPGAQVLIFRDVTASRIRRDLDERRRELLALSAVSTAIASSLEVDQVIARALQQLPLITRLDRAVVYLVDSQDSDHLHLAGNLALSDALPDPPSVLPLWGSKAGDVVRSRQVAYLSRLDQENPQLGVLLSHGLMNGVTVPLIVQERVIGVLQIGRCDPRPYDAVEVALLESVGRQLAIAIDNARLHSEERRQRQVAEALREMAGILANNPLDDALQSLLDKLGRVLAHDRSTILLLAEPGQLAVRASVGFADNPAVDSVRLEVAHYPPLLQVFTQRAAQLVPDTAQHADWVPGSAMPGSWIGAPLIVHDQVLGVLSISHDQPGYFTESDMHIAAAFAAQAGIAVENTQLFEAEQYRRVQAELLQQASYDLVTNSDLDSALLSTLVSMEKMLHFDQAHITLLNENDQTWALRASYPPSQPASTGESGTLDAYPLVQIQRVLDSKRAILIHDTRQDKWWKPDTSAAQEVRCWIGMPLLARDRLIGVLSIDSYTPHCYTVEQLQMVSLFANQMAAALENFRLLEEASRQNRALSALNTVLAASNEALMQQNRLAIVLERMLETLHLGGGAIHESDPASGQMHLRAVAGLPHEVVDRITRLPLATVLPAVALPSGETYAFFSVPLVSHGVGIGLLSIWQDDKTAFSIELQQLLTSIGQQLGVVMDNAILFEDTLQREMLSTNLGRLSLAISAQLDSSTVLDLICRESVAVFNAHGAYIWLLKDGQLIGEGAHGPGAEQFRQTRCPIRDPALLPMRVIYERRPQYINNAADSPEIPPDFIEMTGAKAVIAVPLIKGDTSIGTLMLINTRHPDAFADWLVEQIGLLGIQAALAIQNAGLFDEIRRRLDHLRLVNEVGQYATAILSPKTLMEGVARKLADTLRYDMVSLFQLEDDSLVVHAAFVQGQHVPASDVPGLSGPVQEIAQQAIWRAEPVLRNRQCAPANGSPGGGTACCSLAVPLIVANEAIGVLYVERQGHDSITPQDFDVLEPLAAQLAISVSNARLFEKVRQQTVELEARVIERTAEIRQQQERTEAILRSVADAVIVFDLVGQVVMTNPVAKELFDQHDLDLDLGARVGSLVSRTLDAEADTSDFTEIIELGGVTVQAKASRVVEGQRVLGAVVVMRDISRLKELDRMKDMFVSNVSHELRTPLANLKLYVSLLEKGRVERRADYMAVMDREVQRLERLISDLLDLSRLQSEHRSERPQVRQPINIEALINTVIHDNFAWAESRQCTLRHERLSSTLPWIAGDPDQIVRALTNLVSNAISYTPECGQVLVRSRAERSEQTGEEWVIIEVVDNGIGIPAAELPMIFERFYRGTNVSPNIPGTGLGLAIIKEIVELHGGSIEADSEEGRGSTFRLRLPVST